MLRLGDKLSIKDFSAGARASTAGMLGRRGVACNAPTQPTWLHYSSVVSCHSARSRGIHAAVDDDALHGLQRLRFAPRRMTTSLVVLNKKWNKGGFQTRPYKPGIRRLAVSRRRTPTGAGLSCAGTLVRASTVGMLGRRGVACNAPTQPRVLRADHGHGNIAVGMGAVA